MPSFSWTIGGGCVKLPLVSTVLNMKKIFAWVLFLACGVLYAALDYADPALWVYRENTAATEERPADVFFLCPTTCISPVDNMDVRDAAERETFKHAVDMEKGIYCDRARFFAPYYRQKSMPRYMKPGCNEVAYGDVKAAFLYYLEHDNQGRPFVLAGFSQGGEHALHLIKDVLADPAVARRMVAAYLIGWCVTPWDTAAAPHLRPAQGETDTGVFIAWNTEEAETQGTFIVPKGVRAYCINPLNWSTDDTPAPAESNMGARFNLQSLDAPVQPQYCGAVINAKRGTLVPLLPPGQCLENELRFFAGSYHGYDPMFFYTNHRHNVNKRIEAYLHPSAP